MKPALVYCGGVILALLSSVAGAHEKREAITNVLFNERTGNIEVMHRFSVHDAEHAVDQLFGTDADLLGSDVTRQTFADYVRKRFDLQGLSGQSLPLTVVGHELDGRYLWIYSECPIPTVLDGLTVRHDALRELWPDQVNLVNIEREKRTQSLILGGKTRRDSIHFDAD